MLDTERAGRNNDRGGSEVPGVGKFTLVLAAVTMTCLLLTLLALGARIAAAAGVFPQASRAAALREKSWLAGFVPQLDPDGPGRARPGAPSEYPAAA